VIVDWRGHFGSNAWPDNPLKRGQDGYDAVEWIASQSWSDGAVGGWGESALGYAQYRTAIEHPPHFLAAVPMFIDPVRDYQQFFMGGVQKYEYFLQQALLGYIDYSTVLGHYTHDAYWGLSEALGDSTYDQIEIPMLIIGGWYDLDPADLLDAFVQLRSRSAAAVRDEQRMVVGPWTHADEDVLAQGELEYPAAVGLAATASLAFLDHHLRGVGPGLPDRVGWFEMGRDLVRTSDVWPLPDVVEHIFHLLPSNRIAEEAPPAGDPTSTVVGDPSDPSPTRGGPRALLNPVEGPVDIAPIVESRADALVFSTDVLTEPLSIVGAPRVELSLDTDRLDTDIMVRMADVYPDGRSVYVTDGARRGRFRTGYDAADETLLTPYVTVPIEVDLEPTGLTILPGHKLRLVITTSNWPRFDVNANDGSTLYDPGATPLVVTDRIHLGAVAPSQLVLPIWPPDLFADDFESAGTGAWSGTVP